MRKRLFIALILILMLVPTVIAQAKSPLRAETTYYFFGDIFDSEGRLHAWEGPISGDINGVIIWWMVVPFKETGQASHWTGRWEIWDGDTLLLAGEEAGSTTARHGKNSVWRANGIVTEASPGFEYLIGRKVHDGGHFTWQVIETPEGPLTIPKSGTGEFRIN